MDITHINGYLEEDGVIVHVTVKIPSEDIVNSINDVAAALGGVASEEKPKRTRRSSAQVKADKKAAKEAEEDEDDDEDEEPKRDKKGKDKKITDKYLVEITTEAAEVLTPKAVKRVLGSFDVEELQELEQEDRREYVSMLKTKMNDEDDD